jgi:crotonobetainyl-CoA:carnitine CoA-transferase CaiB-like acyl-CoA transferase
VNKRGVTLDLSRPEGAEIFRRLVATADVIVDATPIDFLRNVGLDYPALRPNNERILMASVTPFGQTGPMRNYKSSDLIHLALGGIVAVCGYDPNAAGEYDTPPVAPQMWHAYQIASHCAFMGLLGALFHREATGVGQFVDVSIHEACACHTELAPPYFMYNEALVRRVTNRHAHPWISEPITFDTGDGRHACAGSIPVAAAIRQIAQLLVEEREVDSSFMDRFADDTWAESPEAGALLTKHLRAYITRRSAEEVYHAGQARHMAWAAVRRPEDNLHDAQFAARGAFTGVVHEEIGSLPYTTAPWLAEEMPWTLHRRAPHLGEHNDEIYGRELGLDSTTLDHLRKEGVV